MKSGNILIPGYPYNPYRVGEDRRRIEAYWQVNGFFDVEVLDFTLTEDEEEDEFLDTA